MDVKLQYSLSVTTVVPRSAYIEYHAMNSETRRLTAGRFSSGRCSQLDWEQLNDEAKSNINSDRSKRWRLCVSVWQFPLTSKSNSMREVGFDLLRSQPHSMSQLNSFDILEFCKIIIQEQVTD
jgi:hypothetical protein